jgi:hypothetical protein
MESRMGSIRDRIDKQQQDGKGMESDGTGLGTGWEAAWRWRYM